MKAFVLMAWLVLAGVSGAVADKIDEEIRAEIQRRVGPPISVSVQGGAVSLSGTVTTLAQKVNAANQAWRTIGVRSVSDGIRVVPARKVRDDEIARSARASISGGLPEPEADVVGVSVRDGVVTLSGFLPNCHTKQVAGMLVSVIPGVVDLVNEIVVRPPKRRSDAEILSDVRARFSKNPLIPADRIRATVFDGIVVLTGTVSSFLQADQAESCACFVPGVITVRNQLFVSGE